MNNQYKKGEMFVNLAGWAGIVMQATRGNNPEIIPMVEVYGFEHECGSIYTNEIARRISESELEEYKTALGHQGAKNIFKGQLINPEE